MKKLNMKKIIDRGIVGLGVRLSVLFILVLLSASNVNADGIIIPDPIPDMPHYTPQLAIKYHHVNVTIDNQYARTDIDQVFENEFHRDLEGTYIFPLPEGASISNFAMFVDEEKLEGEILEKDEARQIYEDIVRRMEDPALLEYVGRDMFKARVYPIPANGEKRIQMGYSEVITCDSGICKYLYPLDAERFSSKPLEDVTISVKIRSKQPIKAVYSPSHEIRVKRVNDYEVEVSYEETDVKPDKDFLLYYTISEKDFGINLLTYRDVGEDGFFMLMIAPKQEIPTGEIIAKDMVFVLDTSGSMSGTKIEQAKNALKFCINGLNEEDKFDIIAFSSEINRFKGELIPVNSDNTAAAINFIDSIVASGGTNINDALLDALKLEPSTVVFITDGKPTVGTTDMEDILSNIGKVSKDTRIFVFGVGYDVNTHLLDKISEQNSGISEYVRPEEDIEVKVSNFYAKIKNPILSDLTIDFGGIDVIDRYPKTLPDLFKGSQLILFGRYRGDGDAVIKLTGEIGDEEKTHTYEVYFPRIDSENTFIPRLWATRKIGYLLDEIRLNGEDQELIDEIITLSTTYGIITPYTSFLIEIDTNLDRPGVMEEARHKFANTLSEKSFFAYSGSSAVDATQATQWLRDSEVSKPESEDVKFIGTKTFYLKEGIWMDSTYKGENTTDIKYLSDEYFEVLGKYPELNSYFSIGREVVVCLRGTCIKVGESGDANVSDIDIPPPPPPDDGYPPEPPGSSGILMLIGAVVILAAVVFVGMRIQKRKT